MVRTHLAAALGGACIALYVTFQLISSFGFPQLSFLNLHYVADRQDEGLSQVPIFPTSEDIRQAAKGTPYLLGVGKADITGLVASNSDLGSTITDSTLGLLLKST